MIKKRQLAAIIVGVLGFGATVTEAQLDAPFLTNDTLSLTRAYPDVISRVGAGAGDDSVVFDTNGFNDGVTTAWGGEEKVGFTRPAFTGLRFDLSPRLSLGLGYKNLAAEDPYCNFPPLWYFATTLEEVRTASILFTVRLKF